MLLLEDAGSKFIFSYQLTPLFRIIKNVAVMLCLCTNTLLAHAQSSGVVKKINNTITRPAALAPLRFLASDELMGRSTKRSEINIAARYISEQFKSFSLKEMPGTNDYFQTFDLVVQKPATTGSLIANGNTYQLLQSLLQVNGGDVDIKAPILYVRQGTEGNVNNADVQGKIVITVPGKDDSSFSMQQFFMLDTTRKLLQQKGAVALVERHQVSNVSWSILQRYLGREKVAIKEKSGSIPVFISRDSSTNENLSTAAEGTLAVKGTQITTIPARNVIGYVEGTDSKLKDQYIVLSAHYDHLGVTKQPKMEDGKIDSIYNGARDNAIGTAAVMDAAQYFALHPPKRSVLFVAYTAEEVGEIGSRYFSEHPPIPLKQMVYNLNIDNASYNDTSIVTVVGLGRTSADEDIKKACAAFGLAAKPDPAPEQNLFDRSDNTNLAIHGIPAPTFSLGIAKFNEEINKRYHQLSDEVGNFNLDYAMKYIHAFILAAKNIADNPKQPEWIKGDKYEAAWKQLYR